jgi:hypothetical protein
MGRKAALALRSPDALPALLSPGVDLSRNTFGDIFGRRDFLLTPVGVGAGRQRIPYLAGNDPGDPAVRGARC